jgi:polysaccharide chain length determinant protein (PEP-CTERM system associated)
VDELLQQVAKYLRAMWKYRWFGLVGAGVFGLIGSVVVLKVPDKYEASARIYVDTQSILQPLMAGLAVQPNVDQQIDMLSRTLINRPNVEKLVHMADLDLKVNSPAAKEALIDSVTKGLSIKTTGRDNLYTLSYRDPVPATAKRVVESLTTIFVDSNLGNKREDSNSAKQFIDQQVADYEKKLQDIETKIKDFKIRNVDIKFGDGKGVADNIADISTQLEQARMELREAVGARDSLRRQLITERPIIAQGANFNDAVSVTPEIDARLQALHTTLDSLLQRYTEQHPDVIQTRMQIRELEKQRQAAILARQKAATANPDAAAQSNPIYQQLKISLGAAEANVASLQGKVSEIAGQYNRAMGSLKQAPQLEAEYTQLTRDYSTIKGNYDQLIARRDSADMSGKLEAAGGVADFRLIDPPRVSSDPVEPNRLLLLSGVYLASLVVGLFISFAASQLRPVIFDSYSLRELTGLPVLGVLSMVNSEKLEMQESLSRKRFLMGTGGLIVLYVITMIAAKLVTGRGF